MAMENITVLLSSALTEAASRIITELKPSFEDSNSVVYKKLSQIAKINSSKRKISLLNSINDAISSLKDKFDLLSELSQDDTDDLRIFFSVGFEEFLFSGRADFGRLIQYNEIIVHNNLKIRTEVAQLGLQRRIRRSTNTDEQRPITYFNPINSHTTMPTEIKSPLTRTDLRTNTTLISLVQEVCKNLQKSLKSKSSTRHLLLSQSEKELIDQHYKLITSGGRLFYHLFSVVLENLSSLDYTDSTKDQIDLWKSIQKKSNIICKHRNIKHIIGFENIFAKAFHHAFSKSLDLTGYEKILRTWTSIEVILESTIWEITKYVEDRLIFEHLNKSKELLKPTELNDILPEIQNQIDLALSEFTMQDPQKHIDIIQSLIETSSRKSLYELSRSLKSFFRITISETIFSSQPDIDRVELQYHNIVQFNELYWNTDLPTWSSLSSSMTHYFDILLSEALSENSPLHDLFPSNDERVVLSTANSRLFKSSANLCEAFLSASKDLAMRFEDYYYAYHNQITKQTLLKQENLSKVQSETEKIDIQNQVHQRLQLILKLEVCQLSILFEDVLLQSLSELSSHSGNIRTVIDILMLLTGNSKDTSLFLQTWVEELFFWLEPDIGRLVDTYRQRPRFSSLIYGRPLPSWISFQSTLFSFSKNIEFEMNKNQTLKIFLFSNYESLLLSKLGIDKKDEAITENPLISNNIDILHQLKDAKPEINQQIIAVEGSSISHIQQYTVLFQHITDKFTQKHDLETLYRRYKGFIIESFGTIDFRGIVQMQNIVKLRLEDIYIQLYINNEEDVKTPTSTYRIGGNNRHSPLQNPDEIIQKLSTASIQQRRISLHELVRDVPFLVVLGNPGAGKSTLVRYVLLSLAEQKARQRLGLHAEWIPILFPVAAFAEARQAPGREDLAPLDYLGEYYVGLSQPDYGPLFRHALIAGHALIMFDGLDEVRQDRLGITRCLEAFVREWDAPGNRFMATSRIAGYQDAPLDNQLFISVTASPFTDDDINLFISQWSRSYEQAGNPQISTSPDIAEFEMERRINERVKSLQSAVFATSNVIELARNPLLLTILALIHNQGTRLPDRRVDLYRLCVEALAETWNRARSLSGREIDVYLGEEKLDERFVVNLLGPAALWIHTEQPGGLVEQSDLERQIADTLVQTDGLPKGKALRLAQSFVELVRNETGLLQERGHRRYGFLHLTFEEYLAARALVESATVDEPAEIIQTRCTDPGWREVLRLAIATASQREAQRLLLHLLRVPTTPELQGRPGLLAAECLLDIGRSSATQRAWMAVTEHLIAIMEDLTTAIEVKIEAGHFLGQLGDLRLLDLTIGEALHGSYWCRIEQGPFWLSHKPAILALSGFPARQPRKRTRMPYSYNISRYLVTNFEFSRFVEDGGYQDRRWWTSHGWEWVKRSSTIKPSAFDHTRFSEMSQPVVGVCWYESVAYCNWITYIGHKTGWLPKKDSIRLPTMLEWERAARHTDKRRYPWGSVPPNENLANFAKNETQSTTPVGCFPSGAAFCGALDLAGNAQEWTATSSKHIYDFSPRSDFIYREMPVVCGGSLWSKAEDLSCDVHRHIYTDVGSINQGFRLVWTQGVF